MLTEVIARLKAVFKRKRETDVRVAAVAIGVSRQVAELFAEAMEACRSILLVYRSEGEQSETVDIIFWSDPGGPHEAIISRISLETAKGITKAVGKGAIRAGAVCSVQCYRRW